MVKDHSDSKKGNPLPPHRLLFPINSKSFFYMHHPTDRIAHTTAVVTPVVEHWLEREIAQWVHSLKDRSDDPSHHERTLLPRSFGLEHTRYRGVNAKEWTVRKLRISYCVSAFNIPVALWPVDKR